MFVKYTPKNPHIKVIPLLPDKKNNEGYAFDNDSVTLRPGVNEITEKEWDAIQPHIKDQLGKEIVAFTVEGKPGKGGGKRKAKTLKDVPVSTARKLIQDCKDPKTLKKWFEQELPDEILLVLSKQMRKLKVEPEDGKDDAEDALKDSDINPENTKADSAEDDEDDADTETEDDEEGGGDDLTGDEDDAEDDDEIPDFDGSKSGGKK